MKSHFSSTLGLAMLALTLADTATAQPVNAGQQFYQKVCAKCHEAGIGPVITGRGLPEIVYTTFVRNGNRAMPAFRVTDIDDATLKELATYLSNTPAKPGVQP